MIKKKILKLDFVLYRVLLHELPIQKRQRIYDTVCPRSLDNETKTSSDKDRDTARQKEIKTERKKDKELRQTAIEIEIKNQGNGTYKTDDKD